MNAARPRLAEVRRYTARARERERATPHLDRVYRYLADADPYQYDIGGGWVTSSPVGTWVRVVGD
jgi:hypothetical protein